MVKIPASLRKTIYSVSIVAMPIVAYLADQGTISTFAFGLATVVNSSVLLLARINVSDK